MTQLYTITIRKLSFTHNIDGSVTEHHKLENMSGIPAQLVATWRQMHPDSIVAVTEDAKGPARGKRFSRGDVVRARRSHDHRGTSAGSEPHVVEEADFSLGGLINTAVSELNAEAVAGLVS